MRVLFVCPVNDLLDATKKATPQQRLENDIVGIIVRDEREEEEIILVEIKKQ